MKYLSENATLRELGSAFDLSGINPKYLDMKFKDFGDMTWNDIDPTGTFIKHYNAWLFGTSLL